MKNFIRCVNNLDSLMVYIMRRNGQETDQTHHDDLI